MILQRAILFLMVSSIAVSMYGQKTVTQHPEFNTVGQSMWGPDNTDGLNTNFVFFPEYSFNQPFSTESFTLLSFAGLDFGAVIDGNIAFGVGPFTFDMSGFVVGNIDVNYPATVNIIMPDDGTYNPGDTIIIKSSFEAETGAELITYYPQAGTIGLYMGVMFDASFGFKMCFIDCIPRISIIPPPGLTFPKPLFKKNFKFFEVSQTGLTYICNNTADPVDFALHPFECDVSAGGPPWSITPTAGNAAFTGTMDIPLVETTSSIVPPHNLQAEGADPYLIAAVDLVQLLGYIPVLKPITEILDFRKEIRPFPDITGTKRGIELHWNILSLNLNMPLSQSQRFNFEPRIFTTLTFTDTVDYIVHSKRTRSNRHGRGVSLEYEVEDSVSLRVPCNYDFMDVQASHRIGRNTFRNKTFDNLSLELDFSAIDFDLTIDEYIIIPEICIPLGFTDLCIGPIGSPEVVIDPPPLIDPPPVTLFSADFPPYFESEWELGGFNTVTIPDPFKLRPRKRDVNFAVQNVTCHGEHSGAITTTLADASTPLTYEWSFGGSAANPVNVPAGAHYLKLTDVNRCESIEPVIVTEPPAIDIAVSHTPVLCNDGTSVITSSASGGTGPLSFAWSSGETTPVVTGKTAGEYFITVTDALACTSIDSVTITAPTPLKAKIASAINPSCANAEDGSLTLFVEGGTAPYTFQWSNGSSRRDQQQLEGGSYTITVTDANHCTTSDSRTLIEPTLLNATLSKLSDVSCYGGKDGALQVNVAGGTPPYTYRWYDSLVTLNNATPSAQGLKRGSYSVEVTDSRDCRSVQNITVRQPSNPLQADIIPIPGLCNGQADGSLDLVVKGGTSPYRYAWSNGQTSEDLLRVAAGRYEITVTDAQGCQNKNKTLLADPEALRIVLFGTDVSCADQKDGKISITKVVGGVPPYSMEWSTGAAGESITDLAAGTYSVTVTDATGCRSSENQTIGTQDIECLFIPNTFSPNGDNTNDTWNIRNIHLYPEVEIKVFNKWGTPVFESTGYPSPWDGTHQGKPLEAATYYYVINLHNGDPIYQGFLMIIK